MRKLFAAAFLFLCASASYGQGAAYTAGPFNTSGPLYVCTTPVTTTPCSSFASLFSNAALSSAISNPFPMTAGVAITFYVTPGQYAVQMPNAGFSQIVTIGGGSSGLSYTGTTPPIPAVTTSASPLCPTSGSTTCNFVFDDGYVVATNVTTATNGTITCPSNNCNFTTITQPQYDGGTIVGLLAWTVNTATVAQSPVPTCAISTIATVAAQQITLASGSCASNNTANQTLVIGHKDGANLATAWTNTGCGTLNLPTQSANPIAPVGAQAVMLVERGEFNSQPTSCSPIAANGIYGSPSLWGASPVSVTLIATPDFPFTTVNCAGVANSGIVGSYNVCFGPAPVIWYGVGVVGFGFNSCGSTALVWSSAGTGGAMSYSNHNNVCATNGSLIGTLYYGTNFRMIGGGVQNVGQVAARVPSPAGGGTPARSDTVFLTENALSSGPGPCVGLQVDAGAVLVDESSLIQNTLINGLMNSIGTDHLSYNGGTCQNAAAKLFSSTAILNCMGCSFNATNAALSSPGATSVGLFSAASGAVANITGTSFCQGSPTGGFALNAVAGAVINDLGGNAVCTANSGTVFGGAGTAQGINFVEPYCTGTASASSTLFLTVTGLSSTGTGFTSACTDTATEDRGKIIQGGGHTIYAMYCRSSATTVSVACTVRRNGASATSTCTMTAATSCFDGTHQVALSDGDLIDGEIVTGAAETGANVKMTVLIN